MSKVITCKGYYCQAEDKLLRILELPVDCLNQSRECAVAFSSHIKVFNTDSLKSAAMNLIEEMEYNSQWLKQVDLLVGTIPFDNVSNQVRKPLEG